MMAKKGSKSSNFREAHRERVRFFRSLYSSVTEEMRRFRDDEIQDLNQDQKAWITALIDGFRLRYEKWLDQEERYLRLLYRQRWNVFDLFAHAYLHIIYDLTYVISQSLRALELESDQFDVNEYEELYQRLQAPLSLAIDASWERPWLVWVATRRKVQMDGLIETYIFSWRNFSWRQAEKTLDKGDKEVSDILAKVHKRMISDLKKSMRKTLFWARIFSLRAPDLIFRAAIIEIVAIGAIFAAGFSAATAYLVSVLFAPIAFELLLRGLMVGRLKVALGELSPPETLD